jgi:sugar fermentation stimulation protein A
VASFPDAVTARGLKHLRELQRLLAADTGGSIRCVMFYLVQRMDAVRFEPATRIDPAYGGELRKAAGKGVEILVYDVRLDPTGVRVHRPLPYEI